jgi:hypothetical protein
MWENLARVRWARLSHAYGLARDVPRILRAMVANDEEVRKTGWNHFWGAVNHQGDFYDSTVAVVPFLIDALTREEVPCRVSILDYLRRRWLEAPDYGGDPYVPDPPGGVGVPTPVLTDVEFATVSQAPSGEAVDKDAEKGGEDDTWDPESMRPMDLCAWQFARAVQAGRPVYAWLLEDSDRKVSAEAAMILLLWHETRAAGKRTMIRTIEDEADPIEQAGRILEFGVYAAAEDVPQLVEWAAPHRPMEVRAAAALAAFFVAIPAAQPAAEAVQDLAVPDCGAFARLPPRGIYEDGLRKLPAYSANVVLRLADNLDDDLRWRALQALSSSLPQAQHLSALRLRPCLVRRLSDHDARVRSAAALLLSQHGESIWDVERHDVSVLLNALDDAEASVCGHVACLLALLSPRLSPGDCREAIARIDGAIRRFSGDPKSCVRFETSGVAAAGYLKEQRARLLEAKEPGVIELLAASFDEKRLGGRSPLGACDRKLADAYARDPRKTLADAVRAVEKGDNRSAALGAARWLTTLGLAAGPALRALDAMAQRKGDPYAQGEAKAAAAFIRWSFLTPWPGVYPEAAPLDHPETYLGDDRCTYVGITGKFEVDGRIYHWRQERRCPREAALRALFAGGSLPEGRGVLDALIAESTHAAVLCGDVAIPHRFPIADWRRAVAAAGGLAVADPLIRAARQRCRAEAQGKGSDGKAALACELELAEIIRQLSGRLV